MTVTRRSILGLSTLLLAACGRSRQKPAGVPEPTTLRYGDDESQHADLHLPAGSAGSLPVIVVLHGGFWRASYGYSLGTPLAADLASRGWAAWNLEYRRVGNGGGWPTTFTDVAAGIDALATVAQPAAGGRLDLGTVAAIGHSAGGHLALWAAGRGGLPAGAPGGAPKVTLSGAVAQAGVTDLVRAAEDRLGGGATIALLRGTPAEHPGRYALASPAARPPLDVPVALVHGEADDIVPIAQSERYAARGGDVRFTRLPGVGHFELIDPATPAWDACRRHLERFRQPRP